MPSANDLDRPLSDDEQAALEEFLARPGGPDLDVAVGFLTAVVTAPTLIPPSEWFAPVLGKRGTTGSKDPALGLLLRLHATIDLALARGRVLAPPADQPEDVELFCTGYLMGVGLAPEWLDDAKSMDYIYPIAVLSGHELSQGEGAEQESESYKEQAREELTSVVLKAYEQLADRRGAGAASNGKGRARAKAKVGRNDPCPCGSGKKHKRCCLGKAS